MNLTDATWAALERPGADPVETFDASSLAGLPEPAQRLLSAAIPDGSPLATAVELEMHGRIKLGVWLPFTARQVLRAGVGFVWAPVVGGRILRFVGADLLGPDGARMQFRLHDRITVVDSSGPDTERSAAGRLAAETAAWLPQALTPQAGATWQGLDDEHATVSLPGPSGSVDVDVTVDGAGALAEILVRRWNDSAKPPGLEPFGGTITATFEADGIRIAGEGRVGWERGAPTQDDAVFFEYTVTSASWLTDTER